MRYFLTGLFIILSTFFSVAQTSEEAVIQELDTSQNIYNSDMFNSQVISENEKLVLLEEAYWSKKQNIGYRVQIHSGRSSWEATKIKSDFIKANPEGDKAYVLYQAPNFKVRIGDFRNRLKATEYLNKLKETYPGAFLVKDEIEIPSNLKEDKQ